MLIGTLNKIREEKAARLRDIDYIREMAEEDSIDDRLFELELKLVKESGNIYAESALTVNQIPTDTEFRKEEINRILNSDHELTFDEMIGLEDED